MSVRMQLAALIPGHIYSRIVLPAHPKSRKDLLAPFVHDNCRAEKTCPMKPTLRVTVSLEIRPRRVRAWKHLAVFHNQPMKAR